MSNLRVIGIGGTNGSGKDTVGHLLSSHHDYLFISVTELLRQECRKRGIDSSRENLRTVSAQWRREHGLGVLVLKAYEQYLKNKESYAGLVIASLRNPGEALEVHKLGGVVMWLDADPKVRYERIKKSAEHRSHRIHEDNKTYDEFIAEEEAEMHSSGDEATLNMAGVRDQADIRLENSFKSTESFKPVVEEALGLPV
jgi:shikimate kinase